MALLCGLAAFSAALVLWLADAPAASVVVQRSVVIETRGWPAAGRTTVHLISELGVPALLVLLIAGGATRRLLSAALVRIAAGVAAALLAYLVSELLKTVVDQPRPCHLATALGSLVACPSDGDWSFPSNHATLAAGLAVAVVAVAPRLWAIALPVAAMVALSRVALGVHYPHDVIAGAVIGTVMVAAAHLILRLWSGRGLRRTSSPARLPGTVNPH